MADLDLTQVCRICLMEHKDMQLVVEDVVNKLLDCASVQLPPDSLICAFCKTEVDKWYLFKQQVIRSTEVIRYIEENRIKKEESINESNYALPLIEECYIKTEQPETVEVKQETNVEDTFQEELVEFNEDSTNQSISAVIEEQYANVEQSKTEEVNQEININDRLQEEETHTFQHCCDICGDIFPSYLELSIHNQTHTTEPPKYQCDLCHKTFQSKTGFIWHTKMHSALKLNVSSERFPCPQCPQIYEKKASLMDHLKWKHNHEVKKPKKLKPQTDPLECQICKKKFESPRGINLHKSRKCHNDPVWAPPKWARLKRKKRGQNKDF